MTLIGRSVKRLEDRPLLTGSGRFAADISVPDMLYMRVVRSPVAFGRLTGVRSRRQRCGRSRHRSGWGRVAAAVDDALGWPGALRQLPITPNRLHPLLAELPAEQQ